MTPYFFYLYEFYYSDSFLGPYVPSEDWHKFCALWKHERDSKVVLQLQNRICFVVISGKVNVKLTKSDGKESCIVRSFKAGDIIHLFSNTDKLVKTDPTSLEFDDVRMQFMLETGTSVSGLDEKEFDSFIKERPKLYALKRFMLLRLSTLFVENVYFKDIKPQKVHFAILCLYLINTFISALSLIRFSTRFI